MRQVRVVSSDCRVGLECVNADLRDGAAVVPREDRALTRARTAARKLAARAIAKRRRPLREQALAQRPGAPAQARRRSAIRRRRCSPGCGSADARQLGADRGFEHGEVVLVAEQVTEAIELVQPRLHPAGRDALERRDLVAVGLHGAAPGVKVDPLSVRYAAAMALRARRSRGSALRRSRASRQRSASSPRPCAARAPGRRVAGRRSVPRLESLRLRAQVSRQLRADAARWPRARPATAGDRSNVFKTTPASRNGATACAIFRRRRSARRARPSHRRTDQPVERADLLHGGAHVVNALAERPPGVDGGGARFLELRARQPPDRRGGSDSPASMSKGHGR